MTATIIMGDIRARRPITAGIRLERGQTFAVVRFPNRAAFRHMQARLGWSAFELVETDEKQAKESLIRSVLKDQYHSVERVEALEATVEGLQAELRAVKARNREQRRERLSLIGILRADPDLAVQLLAAGPVADAKDLLRRARDLEAKAEAAIPPTGLASVDQLKGFADYLAEMDIHTVQDLAATEPAAIRAMDYPPLRGREAELVRTAATWLAEAERLRAPPTPEAPGNNQDLTDEERLDIIVKTAGLQPRVTSELISHGVTSPHRLQEVASSEAGQTELCKLWGINDDNLPDLLQAAGVHLGPPADDDQDRPADQTATTDSENPPPSDDPDAKE